MERIPNTLDFVKEAKLSLNFLSRCVDKLRSCRPYFEIRFEDNHTVALHTWADFGDITGRWVDAFILARLICGSQKGIGVESRLRDLLLSYFSEGDGLSYRPKPARKYKPEILERVYDEHIAEGFDQSKTLRGLCTWYEHTKDKEAKEYLNKLIDGLYRVAIKKNDYIYYAHAKFKPGYVPQNNEKPIRAMVYYGGSQILSLLKAHKLTHNRKALELARGLTRYIINHSGFGKTGTFGFRDFREDGHTHSHIEAIAGIIKYGMISGEERFIKWGSRAFEWFIKSHGSSIGWFPEWIKHGEEKKQGCETCTISDCVDAAILLAKSGYEEYWEVTERIARNHLVEQQLKDVSFMKSSSKTNKTYFSSTKNIPRRVRGAFAGWGGVNDFVGTHVFSRRLMNCCGPAGLHAIYLIWHNSVTKNKNGIFLNIAINRDTPYLELRSYEPYQGKIEIKLLKSDNLFIRIPNWVRKKDVNLSVNGVSVVCRWQGSYLFISNLKNNTEIVVTYPLRRLEEDEVIGGRKFRIKWKGNTVVGIYPKGKTYPLYQRESLDTDEVIYKKNDLVSCNHEIDW